MPAPVKVATIDQIREAKGFVVVVEGNEIALFKRNGELFALNNSCAHQHFSVLHQGKLDGCTVECPMHGWTYDLRTGMATTGQGRVATYAVTTKGNDVYIELPEV